MEKLLRIPRQQQEKEPIPGGDVYWKLRRQAFTRDIPRVRASLADAEEYPRYTASGYDAVGEPVGITENTGPYEAAFRDQAVLSTNPLAVETLQAHGLRIHRPYPDSEPVILNKRGTYARSWEIPIFGKEKQRKEFDG